MNPWRNWDAQRKAARATRERLIHMRVWHQLIMDAPEMVDRRIAQIELQLRDTPSSTE